MWQAEIGPSAGIQDLVSRIKLKNSFYCWSFSQINKQKWLAGHQPKITTAFCKYFTQCEGGYKEQEEDTENKYTRGNEKSEGTGEQNTLTRKGEAKINTKSTMQRTTKVKKEVT